MTTAAQTRAIHSIRRNAPQFTEEDYRALLNREFRTSSSKTLSERQAAKLIEMLKVTCGQSSYRGAAVTAEGPFAGKLRALWMSAHNLGLVRSRDDRAMMAFVKRQTKIEHTRFLVEPAAAMKAIEALKKWISRESGIVWPGADSDPAETKRIVALAVAGRCVEAGAFKPFCEGTLDVDLERYAYRCGGFPASFEFYEPAHWDRLANRLGARLRAKLADRERQAA